MIREASEADLGTITTILNDAIWHTEANFESESKSDAEMREWFDSHQKPYIILVDTDEKDAVCGYASLSPYRNGKAVVSVYISQDHRKERRGRKLLEALKEYSAEQNEIGMLIAYITENNAGSIRLFESAGFKPAGKIENAGDKFGKALDLWMYRYSCKRKEKQ